MDELLTRGVDQIIGQDELEKALKSSRKLRIKFGVDPTRPDIHLGHAVALRKLRQFQDLGHTVIFLIGDYTTKIGDPSGRSKTRPMLTDAEIEANAQTYLDQVGDIIDLKKVEIRRNSEWLSGLTFADLIELSAKFSVAQLIERDDFEKRLKAGEELSLHELLYPLMQAYDSVALKADMEFGGTDQLFNLLAGRDLQRKMDQRPQVVFTVKLLVGTDGSKKMSKSLDNYVSLTDEPVEMYGKLMSMRDELIVSYYELCTDIPMPTIHELMKSIAEGANPRDPKASLAREIVGIYHSPKVAIEAEAAWNHQFREGGRPTDIEEFTIRDKYLPLVDVLVSSGLSTSKSEARRLIEQGGVKLDDMVQLPESEPVYADGDILQVGKRRYLKLRLK